ncbi:hypothetical protein PCL_11049 [Purpureocillium lilacinum]|uniref:Uncharacterized protein n=1 Tax=Purpureocillium lilacinum TaxID=33203 RepID=A0A2U3ED49_PURLI|nr:hypothetical protein PCL_11049 [Purpureocillium lilacinum]
MSEGKLKPRVMILAADPSDGLGHVTRLVGGIHVGAWRRCLAGASRVTKGKEHRHPGKEGRPEEQRLVIFPVSAGWCCLLASTKNLGVPVSDSVCDMCERLDPLPRSATGLASTLPRLSRPARSHKLPVSFVRLGRPLRRPRLRAAWLTTESDDDDGYRDGDNNGNSSGSDAIEQRRCGRSTTQQMDRPPRPTWGAITHSSMRTPTIIRTSCPPAARRRRQVAGSAPGVIGARR